MQKLFFLALSILISTALCSQNKINSTKIVTGLSIPVDIAFDHNNTMYVVEKRGTIKRIDQSTSPVSKKEFLNITSIVNSAANERGLLGLAFHPDYKNNGHFFVNYNDDGGATVIARYTRSLTDSTVADPMSSKIILNVAQPYNNHNGGDLSFDEEGYLMIGMGDGGSGGDPNNNSQNTKELLGKMLRIDINTDAAPYLIPANNPFVNSTDILPEIWAIGMRNPWRFSFDQKTQDLWIADVGQNKWEEIDFEAHDSKGGNNYGWRCYEGNVKYNYANCDEGKGYIKPVHVYATNSGGDGCSITGGYVYRGNDVDILQGNYVFGDFCTGNIWQLVQSNCTGNSAEKIMKIGPQELSTFGQDNNGEIYYAELGGGNIYKITKKCELINVEVKTQEAYCTDGLGKVSFDVKNNGNYSVKVNGEDLKAEGYKIGKYNYTIKNDDSGCSTEGCFEIKKIIIDDIYFTSIINEFILCKEDTFFVDLDAFSPRPDSLLIADGPIGEPMLNYFVKDGDYLVGVPEIKSAFLNGCEFPFNTDFKLNAIYPLSPKLLFSSDSLIKATFQDALVTYKSYKLYYNGTLFSESNDGIFKNKFPTGSYQIIGVLKNGCTSEPLKLDIISATKEASYLPINLFPNPTNTRFYISVDDFKEATIFDNTGKQVLQTYKQDVDVQKLSPGVYTVIVNGYNKKYKGQIVVVK